MSKTLEAIFDGEVLRPSEPLELAPDTRVRITIETADDDQPPPASFLQTARSLKLDAPPDWSANLEEYLYSRESQDGE
jgi:predicted DNA-binding antitoxin AbrB/MazE fold protein